MRLACSIFVLVPQLWAQGGGDGTVIDAATRAGIPGVEVRIYARGSSYAAVTDLAAVFKIAGSRKATVVMIPAAGSKFDTIVSTVASTDGLFQFDGLWPGEYQAVAVDRVDPSRFREEPFIQRLAGLGSRVKAEDTGSVSLELRVNRWPE